MFVTMNPRTLSPIDRAVACLDEGLRLVLGPMPTAQRPSPATAVNEGVMAERERAFAGRLMRVNHTGEICAQALYQGQAVTARSTTVRDKMEHAAAEENDHLNWTETRIRELGSRRSYLNPLWYTGSFVIGAIAGVAGDRWSLGFLAETERQVVKHLDDHLRQLPAADTKSRAVLRQMRTDESQHATTAFESGGVSLPYPVRQAMRWASGVMTRIAHWV
jgi:3-demethoxyubiquinol 3-hydroxylase